MSPNPGSDPLGELATTTALEMTRAKRRAPELASPAAGFAAIGHDSAGADINPMALVEYMARSRWQCQGLVHDTTTVVLWRHPEAADSAALFCLKSDHPATAAVLAHTIDLLADHENRGRAAILDDIAHHGTAAAFTADAEWPTTAEPTVLFERRLRRDYDNHYILAASTHPDRRDAARHYAASWALNTDEARRFAWMDLDTTVAAWTAEPALMTGLHDLLERYPTAATSLQLGHHRQARQLTGHAPTDPAPPTQRRHLDTLLDHITTAIAAHSATTDTAPTTPAPAHTPLSAPELTAPAPAAGLGA